MKKIRIKLSVDNPYKATNPKTTSFHFRVNIFPFCPFSQL